MSKKYRLKKDVSTFDVEAKAGCIGVEERGVSTDSKVWFDNGRFFYRLSTINTFPDWFELVEPEIRYVWHDFDPKLGQNQSLPPAYKLVLVEIENTDRIFKNPGVVGFLKYHGGEENKPYFVTHGATLMNERDGDDRVVKWCDCLPDNFQLSWSKFPERNFEQHQASHTPAPESRDWEVVAYNVNIGRNRIFKLVKGLKNLFREDGHFDSKGRGELEAHPLAEIHSVRRLSDNTVWTVGEHVGDNDSIHEFKIEGIHVVGSNDIKVTGFETSVFLSSLKKIPPQPLFVTNDDKGIFPGDSYWHIVSDWTPQMEVATESGRQQYKTRALQTFSTKEEADRHILMNGPSRLSVEDIIYIYKNTSTPSDFQEYIIKLAKSKQSKQ